MPSLNKVTIIGNVGNEPEMRFTPNGKPVTSFSVATNWVYTSPEGERRQETEWFNVVAWNRLAEQCNHLGESRGRYHVALDVVDAGVGEMVMIAQGSSCRQTSISDRKPVDALICGIVDLVDEKGQIVYRK